MYFPCVPTVLGTLTHKRDDSHIHCTGHPLMESNRDDSHTYPPHWAPQLIRASPPFFHTHTYFLVVAVLRCTPCSNLHTYHNHIESISFQESKNNSQWPTDESFWYTGGVPSQSVHQSPLFAGVEMGEDGRRTWQLADKYRQEHRSGTYSRTHTQLEGHAAYPYSHLLMTSSSSSSLRSKLGMASQINVEKLPQLEW